MLELTQIHAVAESLKAEKVEKEVGGIKNV
jgi:hypothetical protein